MQEVFRDFWKVQSAVLLCTDVAARGLDFPEVGTIVQLDPPGMLGMLGMLGMVLSMPLEIALGERLAQRSIERRHHHRVWFEQHLHVAVNRFVLSLCSFVYCSIEAIQTTIIIIIMGLLLRKRQIVQLHEERARCTEAGRTCQTRDLDGTRPGSSSCR